MAIRYTKKMLDAMNIVFDEMFSKPSTKVGWIMTNTVWLTTTTEAPPDAGFGGLPFYTRTIAPVNIEIHGLPCGTLIARRIEE